MQDLLHVLPSLGAPASDLGRRRSNPPAAPSPLSRLVRGTGGLLWTLRDGLTAEQRGEARRLEEREQILALRMKEATTAAQWTAAARELDLLEGNDAWRRDDAVAAPGDYNPALIASRARELDDARIGCDLRAMLHLVRTALSRDLGGMGSPELYRHSYLGTKSLVERYVDAAAKTVEALVDQSAAHPRLLAEAGLGDKDLLEGLLLARQAFGRSALLLSGGGTFGMMHIGVLKAMFEARLLPRLISGASAGSIVCAVLCTRTDEEIPGVLAAFPYGDLAVFEERGNEQGWLEHFRRLLTVGSWSDIRHLARVMRGMLGDMTFQEAYNRTRRICNICVSTASVYELPRLLNYVTAPDVMIWSAVAASCSVPLVFSAAPLLVKDPVTGDHRPWNPASQQWIDGSVDNDVPMTRLAEMFNVNHFIVSQVNPHVVPFLPKNDRLYPAGHHLGGPTTLSSSSSSSGATFSAPAASSSSSSSDWLYTLTTLARDEALHRLHFMAELGLLPNLATKLRSVLSQHYAGDITLLPEVPLQDLPLILTNPTSDFMLRACLAGERATWPKLSRMRDRLAIELAIDRAVHALRARVVFSPSQVDLRRLAAFTGTGTGTLAPVPVFGAVRGPGQRVAGSGGGLPGRHRRGSGSSIQLLARQRRMLMSLEDDSSDDEDQGGRRAELSRRRGEPAPSLGSRAAPAGVAKPRLKRASKSHMHVPRALQASLSGPATPAPAAQPEMGVYTARMDMPVAIPSRPSPLLRKDDEGPWPRKPWHGRSIGCPDEPADTARSPPPAHLEPSVLLLSPPTTASHPETSDRDQADELLRLHESSDLGDAESHTENTESDPEPHAGAEAWMDPAGDGAPSAESTAGRVGPGRVRREEEDGGGLWD